MIMVDSSVWIDFLRARTTPQTDHLKASFKRERILVADLVLAEVLQGTRDKRQFEFTRDLLTRLEVIAVAGLQVAVQAASNYQLLRERGFTIRKTIDNLVATRCILDRIPLLYSDRDFDPFVAHLGMRSALDFGANG